MTTKREIVKTIAEKTALTQAQAAEVVQLAFESIIETVLDERRIELRNFGVFELRERKPRKARDPRTGQTMTLPARQVVVFKPSKHLDERVARLPMPRKARSASPVTAS